MIIMPEAYMNGWRAGCMVAVFRHLRDQQPSDTGRYDFYIMMAEECPYDGRTSEGRTWRTAFANALDAYNGVFGPFILEHVKQAEKAKRDADVLARTLRRAR